MVIVSKNKKNIVNFDSVAEIFLKNEEAAIKVNFTNGGRYELERYENHILAEIAFEMLIEAFDKTKKFIMPNEKEIQAYKIRTHDTKPQHISGKKTKGHGGS